MSEVYFNGPLTICSGNQYRIRLENKLKTMLGEERIIGPMDASINKCMEKGIISEELGKILLDISKFCDESYMCPELDSPSEETIKSWSEVIDKM